MKLSILLVTYNQEKFISECIDSIVMQILPFDYEIIVADDCSTDNTLLIIEKKIMDSGSNYRILKHDTNLGFVKNYEKGFSDCKGEYVAVIEGDDYWTSPSRITKHIDFLENHRECVMSFNRIINFNDEERSFAVPEWNLKDDFEYITVNQLAEGNKIGNLSACIFRNSVIKKLNPDLFNLQIADWMLGMAIGQYGMIAKLKDAMSVYRIHPNGQWSKMSSDEQKKSVLKIIDIYNNFLEYKYDKEFSQLKYKLSDQYTHKINLSKLKDYLPPFFPPLLKLIIPIKARKLIKRIL